MDGIVEKFTPTLSLRLILPRATFFPFFTAAPFILAHPDFFFFFFSLVEAKDPILPKTPKRLENFPDCWRRQCGAVSLLLLLFPRCVVVSRTTCSEHEREAHAMQMSQKRRAQEVQTGQPVLGQELRNQAVLILTRGQKYPRL